MKDFDYLGPATPNDLRAVAELDADREAVDRTLQVALNFHANCVSALEKRSRAFFDDLWARFPNADEGKAITLKCIDATHSWVLEDTPAVSEWRRLMTAETLADELQRLVEAYEIGESQLRQESWNLIADFAVDNVKPLCAALRAVAGEPVAWQWLSGSWHTVDKTEAADPEAYARSFGLPVRPIYTHPASSGRDPATRQTFTIPDGFEADRDAEGRATGEVRRIEGHDPATIEAWISAQFFGHAVAVRAKHDDPILGEPFVSITVAKEIVRRAFAAEEASCLQKD